MKLKKRALEVPSKIRSFIDSVINSPLEEIEDNLKKFVWQYDKGDCYHWVDIFNHFDTFFEKHIKSRKDLEFKDNFLERDPPFPRGEVLQILRVIRIILENCTNKYFYSSCEPHLSSLLASTDPDVVEAALKTLASVMKRAVVKFSVKDLDSKLFAFAQGWGGKEEGLGLIACAVPNGCDTVAYDIGCTLHFEFYTMHDSPSQLPITKNSTQGLQIIHIPNVNSCEKTILKLFNNLVTEYNVPTNLRFSLLTRLRFAAAFHSLSCRQQYTCIRLYAFILFIQAYKDSADLTSFFKNEPEFIGELVSVLSCEDLISEKIRVMCLLSLVALCNDRHQSVVLAAVTSGRHRDILSVLLQKALFSVTNEASKSSAAFAETLLSLVANLVSSSSGCLAMREAGFIPTLLTFITISRDPQHLHLVCSAIHVLEAFIDYSNPAAELFRDLGGLDGAISRLKIEISYVEKFPEEQQGDDFDHNRQTTVTVSGSSAELDATQPLYSEAFIACHRRLLIKALLRVISLGTYAPGISTSLYCSEESMLLHCMCIIFRRAQEFGGAIFSLAATVMNDLIQKDPTYFPVLEASGLPSAFVDTIVNEIVCSAEAITCIPLCLDALCLNNNGLQIVKDRNALKSFIKVFTSRTYSRALTSETVGSLSSGLDELMRHVSSLRGPGVDMLIDILNSICSLGSGTEADISIHPLNPSTAVPMKTDDEENNMVLSGTKDLSMIEKSELNTEKSSHGKNVDSFLPECVRNVARLLETILQNADTCRIFVDKKGVDAVLQLFNLPLMPLSVSIGHSIFVAFKLFSPLHLASLSLAVCLFLKEQLKLTKELLVSVRETQLTDLSVLMKTKVLRSLYSLEGILSLSTCFLKGSASMVSELSSADADALKDLGYVYKEVLWKISLSYDSNVNDTKTGELEPENTDATITYASGRETDSDADIAVERYLDPLSIRNNSLPHWGGGRDFLSVVRSSEGLHRRSGHGLSRIRGGRAVRHLEPLNIDYEGPSHLADSFKPPEIKKKIPGALLPELLYRLASTSRSFFAAVIKGFTLPNRRRPDSGALILLSKSLGTALAKIFLEALSFSGSSCIDVPLLVKCQYLGKVVDDMLVLTFDSRRHTCYTTMINYFYVQGTFKELLTTFEATSQLLWSIPCSISLSAGIELENNGQGNKLSHNSWLLDTLQSYCRLLEYFVNSSLILSSASASQAQLLVQPVAVGLSIGLFPVPRDPKMFIQMMQSQVLDIILPVWNHSLFPNCNSSLINSIVSLVTYIYSGSGDVKRSCAGLSRSTNPRFVEPPLPDENTVSTIVEMGFTRARAEEALRRVERNSVEMAMEWLFSHAENPVQEDDELAQALALSLGSSSDLSKGGDSADRTMDVVTDDEQTKLPPVDEIFTASMKLFQIDSLAFPLADLFMTLCNRCNGEDRPKVTYFLVQQLNLCPLDLVRDTNALGVISHILALLLFEDGSAREIAAQNGIVPVVINIVMIFKARNELRVDVLLPRYISALLLILDNLLQSRLGQTSEGNPTDVPDSTGKHVLFLKPALLASEDQSSVGCENESCSPYNKTFGRLTGYVTMKESQTILLVACDLIKQHVPAIVMQVALQLCARLTKNHALALQFLENGCMVAIFNLPMSSLFPGYDTLLSVITRHLIEDPQTLQTAMELEMRQIIAGSRHGGRISPRTFLTSMTSVIARDPYVFMKTAASVCMLESFGGRTMVVLSKEKMKEKDKAKTSVDELGSSNEGLCISENKTQEGFGKSSKSHKKSSANLTEVIDCLFEIVLKYPSTKSEFDCIDYLNAMVVDEASIKKKGKSKADDISKAELGCPSERCADLARVTFVLKLLSDILQKYVHVVGIVLKRDSELYHPRGSSHQDCFGNCGIFYHVLHRLLPLSMDKTEGPDEWRDKLSQKSSWFLVVVCGRSGEGRKRVVHELVKALTSFSNLESSSIGGILLPDNKIFAFVDLVNSILWKNIFPGSSISSDAAKSLIDGGMVNCLTNILQVIDLDHPNAPKTVNVILRVLESLTRMANASEQVVKYDGSNKKKLLDSLGRYDEREGSQSASGIGEHIQNENNQQEHVDTEETMQRQLEEISQHSCDHVLDANHHVGQNVHANVEDAVDANQPMELSMDFMREEMEDDVLLNNAQIEMSYRVDNRADDYMGDDDGDMGDVGEDEDDDEGGDEDEDDDIAEDGAALMSLVDTDAEDHDDSGLGDEYHDEMIGDEEDGYHENRVIEVRWREPQRETLDGLNHLPVIGQPDISNGIFDVPPEPYDGVDVDDFFGLRRTLGFDQRHHSRRASLDTPVAETHCFQHPLLVRPSQSGELTSICSSTGNRDLESTSGNLYLHDATVIRHNQASSSASGCPLGGAAAPSLAVGSMNDYYALMNPVNLSRQRGGSDGWWWTDDGQPQAGSQAASIAQAVEEQFLYQLHSSSLNSPDRQSLNTRQQEKHVQPSAEGQLIEGDQKEGEDDMNVIEPPNQRNNHLQPSTVGPVIDESIELLHTNELMPTVPALPSEFHNGGDSMEAVEVNIIANEGMNINPGFGTSTTESYGIVQCERSPEVIINSQDLPGIQSEQFIQPSNSTMDESPSMQNISTPEDADQVNQRGINNVPPNARTIDPTFLEALPVDLRVEVLASQHIQPVQAPSYSPPPAEEIDPEFLAALPPDIQAEVLAQQRAQRAAQQADGQPVDMDNASIIATFPSDLREEVLLTSSEAVLSALPSPLLAEAQMLRDRAMSHYQARSLFGSSHTLNNQRNGLGFDRQNVIDRGVRVTRKPASVLNVKEVDGEPLMDSNALKALIRLLRIAQPLNKGVLEKLFLNLCAHIVTRRMLVHFFLDMIKPETEGVLNKTAEVNSQRLYGCQSNGVYGRQLSNGLPTLVLRRVLEVLGCLARNHATVAMILFYFDTSSLPPTHLNHRSSEIRLEKGKGNIIGDKVSSKPLGDAQNVDVPFVLFLKLLNQPLFLRSISHLEELLDLLRVIVQTASSKLEHQPELESERVHTQNSCHDEVLGDAQNASNKLELGLNKNGSLSLKNPDGKKNSSRLFSVFLNLPRSDLHILCSIIGREGLSDKAYKLAGEVLTKLASVARTLRTFFISELSELANGLSSSAISELSSLADSHMLGLSSSVTGDTILRVFKLLTQLSSTNVDNSKTTEESYVEGEEDAIMQRLNVALEPLWKELSSCISSTESQLTHTSLSTTISNSNNEDSAPGGSSSSPPLPLGTHRFLPFIEAFFVLCEKMQAKFFIAQEHANETAREVKELRCGSPDLYPRCDGPITFGRFPEKHRRLLNAFIRQNPGLLEKSFSMMLKAPKLIDFDNKRTHFRSRIKQHLSVPLRICVRRAYVLEDSYNQLRIRSSSDLKGRLNVHFQGEEGIDAGGLTREWYQLLSRVIFDKGALLFTTVGNDASFQPNPNSVYQTEHLSYFKFVGRVVGKALFDGQLLDVHFTRSFYKHILGVKVTYHDIEAVDPDYYKNLKWMLENNMSDIPDLTFSMDADEEKHILYEKAEVTDYELKPGGRNIRVTEETKHEYVDLVADHILTNAIRPQTNSFLEGFGELIPPDLISIFNDKELELLISGLPEIDLDDLKANTEYSGFSMLSRVVQWFWEVVKAFSKEDMARLLQFVTGTSKVPLDGFKALQGISGTQRFQIHKAYGTPERLPSAHTCFNQLDLPEYSSKEQLEERLLLAIHEGSEGFGFG